MHIDENDATELKGWVIQKLTGISDADSDVLADYVLALIRTETPEPQHKQEVLENLEDFLKDATGGFVNQVFDAIKTKSYKPGHIPSPIPSKPPPQAALATHSSRPQAEPYNGRRTSFGAQDPKKRSHNDMAGNTSGGDAHYSQGERQKRSMRGGRGGRGTGTGRGGFDSNGFSRSTAPQTMPNFPNMPQMPPGMGFDHNDPLAALMAMQAMGLPLPSLPGFPQAGSPQGQTPFGQPMPSGFEKKKGKCNDYENKGFCFRGESCPYQHGNDRIVMPGTEEYDPKNAVLMDAAPTSPNGDKFGSPVGRGAGNASSRGRGRGDKGQLQPRRNRADFSQAGPNHDRSVTTIVIEQIPEDKFEEGIVRDFFNEFGTIQQVTMQPYKRLAIVKYEDYNSARKAYDSPKVIFDNRFVKVYWYKPGSAPTPRSAPAVGGSQAIPTDVSNVPEEEVFDREKFEQDTQAAQKKLEEKKAQLEEMASKRLALEKQKQDLVAKQAAEKQKLLDRLAAKGVSVSTSSSLTGAGNKDTDMSEAIGTENTNGNSQPPSKDSAHTALLRAKVAELEAEAKSLGLDAAALSESSTYPYPPRGRGRGYRGAPRGGSSYRGWEAFNPAHRGRGRGGYYPGSGNPGVGGGKYNLDNRTKRVSVALNSSPEGSSNDDNNVWTPEKDEALRQWLLGLGEFEDITSVPNEVPSTNNGNSNGDKMTPSPQQVITFKDRATAEAFLYGGSKERDVPGVGKVELKWFNGAVPPAQPSASAISNTINLRGSDGSTLSTKAHHPAGKSTADDQDKDESMGSMMDADSAVAGSAPHQQQQQAHQQHADVDYDVAEDDDRWMDG